MKTAKKEEKKGKGKRYVMMEAWRYKEAFHYKNLSETHVTGV